MNLETGGCSLMKVLTKKKFGTKAKRKTVYQTGELQKTKLQIPTIHYNAL
jgi:hypothetical protein